MVLEIWSQNIDRSNAIGIFCFSRDVMFGAVYSIDSATSTIDWSGHISRDDHRSEYAFSRRTHHSLNAIFDSTFLFGWFFFYSLHFRTSKCFNLSTNWPKCSPIYKEAHKNSIYQNITAVHHFARLQIVLQVFYMRIKRWSLSFGLSSHVSISRRKSQKQNVVHHNLCKYFFSIIRMHLACRTNGTAQSNTCQHFSFKCSHFTIHRKYASWFRIYFMGFVNFLWALWMTLNDV